MSFLDLTAVKSQLRITSAVSDSAITLLIAAAQDVVERHLDKILEPRPFTDELTVRFPTTRFRLHNTPLVSVESIVDSDGTIYDLTGLVVRSSGLAVLPSAIKGTGYLDVTYTAGLASVPDNYVQAGQIIVQHLWETRRGDMPLASGQLDDSLMMDTRLGIVAGYAIPNRALELLGPRPPVVA